MIVYCNKYNWSGLTMGGRYDVMNQTDTLYYVINDEGIYTSYPKNVFDTNQSEEKAELNHTYRYEESDKFWIVISHLPGKITNLEKFYNFQLASQSAEHLAKENPGYEFVVMGAVEGITFNSMKKTNYIWDNEISFQKCKIGY